MPGQVRRSLLQVAPSPTLKACSCCGLVQKIPALAPKQLARCSRCGSTLVHPGRQRNSNRLCASAALASLLIFPLAISLPIMTIERFGHAHDASIWTGGIELLAGGEIAVGLVVLLCSIVIPLFKLVGLLLITSRRSWLSRHHKASTYHLIEWAGRWGMLDVLLIALLVAWIKVGDLVEVTVGPAALAFTLCVLLSLVATSAFHPHAVWDDDAR
ncbi:MAG: paraquat-inducible protein A [Chlamydiales bacterium]|jgi:paraquat-inducible protein A